MKKFALVLVLLMLFFSSSVLAVIQKDSMQIFAVTTEGQGLGAELTVTTELGTGKVWSSVKPLVGTTTQNAERTAIEVAKIYAGEADQYDYKFEISSNASVVEGPSAGAAMALLAVSMLRNRHVPSEISITGTISSDGSVGPVGGVFEKAQEASRQGIKLFLVPKGEVKQIVKLPSGIQSVNLIDYASKEWGLKIVEVENMDQVLKLAFSDIGTIDINQSNDKNIFDFLPVPIENVQSLGLMREITAKYIVDGKQQVESAKKALNSSMLEDNEIVQALLASLNNSEETLKEAELLFDRNFLYSAANYAFLAKANAMLVKDIAENPSLLSLSSTLFHSRLQEIKKKVQLLESDLSEYIPLDYLEWHIAAQQRVVYADNAISSLLSSQTIVVDTGEGADQYGAIFKRMQDYEFAVAWYDISNSFFEQSKKSTRKILPDNAFKNEIEPMIVQVENMLSVLQNKDNEDIMRRYNAAVREKQLGWYLATGFDAAQALALINSSKLANEETDFNKLYSSLTEKTGNISADMEKASGAFVWTNLYLDHSNYYISGADYYLGQKSEAKALESLKSAISIVFMAEEIEKISKEYYAHYNFIPESKIIKENNDLTASVKQNGLLTIILAIGFVVGWALVVVLAIKVFRKVAEQKKYSLKQQINQVIGLQDRLEKEIFNGKISKEKYFSLHEKYAERLNLLQAALKEKSEQVVEIDSLRARLVGLEHALRSLKSHYDSGLVLNEDYKKEVEILQKEMNSIKSEIDNQKKEIIEEEIQLKQQAIADFEGNVKQFGKEKKVPASAPKAKKQKKKKK